MDVRPEDVLKTFTNSIEPSKRSTAIQNNPFADELSQLSPIRNMKEQKNLVNEIQKIAKEIKKIPTREFRN